MTLRTAPSLDSAGRPSTTGREEAEEDGYPDAARVVITAVRFWAWTIFVIVATLLAAAIATGGISRPLRYELPDGYRGWVLIQWFDARCASLRGDGLGEVLVVPDGGRACTSSAPRQGLHSVEYSVRTPTGGQSLDPSQITIKSLTDACFREQFYVRDLGQESIPPPPADWSFCQGFR